jgi:hypothetical protein
MKNATENINGILKQANERICELKDHLKIPRQRNKEAR